MEDIDAPSAHALRQLEIPAQGSGRGFRAEEVEVVVAPKWIKQDEFI